MRLFPIERTGTTTAPIQAIAEVVTEVLQATVALYGRKGFVPPWTGYLAVEGHEIVGTCGFAGPPHAGEVEIAYFTFPGNEGKGIAKRMASTLLALTKTEAFREHVEFIAHTLPEDGPSTSILRSLGFQLVGEIQHPEDGTVWKWCNSRDAQASRIDPPPTSD
jgi:ribosomal-protein-alanine N-acetyltransferase